jgi:hypothetical protein
MCLTLHSSDQTQPLDLEIFGVHKIDSKLRVILAAESAFSRSLTVMGDAVAGRLCSAISFDAATRSSLVSG